MGNKENCEGGGTASDCRDSTSCRDGHSWCSATAWTHCASRRKRSDRRSSQASENV